MFIKVVPHKHPNHGENYADIIFNRYADVIGRKKYVAYEIQDDKIYFQFYPTKEGDDIHRFKLCAYTPKEDFVFGEPLCINCEHNSIVPFFSQFKYPVYYVAGTDEYCIKLDDVKRKRLWSDCDVTKEYSEKELEENVQTSAKQDRRGRSFAMESDKLGVLLEQLIKENPKLTSIAKISRYMDYSEGALSQALNAHRMSYKMAKKLDKCFSIKKEQYMSVSDIEEQKELSESADNLMDKLYDIVYQAALKACTDAFKSI